MRHRKSIQPINIHYSHTCSIRAHYAGLQLCTPRPLVSHNGIRYWALDLVLIILCFGMLMTFCYLRHNIIFINGKALSLIDDSIEIDRPNPYMKMRRHDYGLIDSKLCLRCSIQLEHKPLNEFNDKDSQFYSTIILWLQSALCVINQNS